MEDWKSLFDEAAQQFADIKTKNESTVQAQKQMRRATEERMEMLEEIVMCEQAEYLVGELLSAYKRGCTSISAQSSGPETPSYKEYLELERSLGLKTPRKTNDRKKIAEKMTQIINSTKYSVIFRMDSAPYEATTYTYDLVIK